MKKQKITFEDRVRETIERYAMCRKGERILVAVSGGIDSISLLHALYRLRETLGITLMVAHFNHRLRGSEAGKDARFVERVAKRLALPYFGDAGDVAAYAKEQNFSTEEAARKMRYAFFKEIVQLEKIDSVAFGHNEDDQAETVLMRVISGTGIAGLAAIRSVLSFEGMRCIRPLIHTSRADITVFVKRHRYRFRDDATNRSLVFVRNKVRHALLPVIEKEFNPLAKKALSRLASSATSDNDFIAQHVLTAFERICTFQSCTYVVFDRQSFIGLHRALWFRLVEQAMRACNAQCALDYCHWEMISDALSAGKKMSMSLGGHVAITADAVEIVIMLANQHNRSFSYVLGKNEVVDIPETGMRITARVIAKPKEIIHANRCIEYVSYDALTFPLTVRNRLPGDRFRPLGVNGAKKVKDYLGDKKVPMRLRKNIPLVVSGSGIVWVGGYGIAEEAKVTPQTKKVVRLELTYL